MRQLKDTTVISDAIESMKKGSFIALPDDIIECFDISVKSLARYLALIKKKKEGSASIAIRDLKGNLIIAAVAKHFPGTEKDMPGNWTMEFTTDEKDLKDIVNKQDASSNAFKELVSKVSFELYNNKINSFSAITDIVTIPFQTLLNWFDKNLTTEGIKEEIERPGYFKAVGTVENGKKVVAIIPDGQITRIIKDDMDISEDAAYVDLEMNKEGSTKAA